MFSILIVAVLTEQKTAIFNVCFATVLTEHKTIIFSVFFATVVLGLSVYVALRTNLLHNSITADVNMYSYVLQADISVGRRTNVCKEIAKEWFKFSEAYRHGAKLRAYSACSCFWSLIFLFITLLLLFVEQLFWVIPFGIAMAFFILSLLIQLLSLEHVFLKKLLGIFPILHPELKRWDEFTRIIENHEWLRNSREN